MRSGWRGGWLLEPASNGGLDACHGAELGPAPEASGKHRQHKDQKNQVNHQSSMAAATSSAVVAKASASATVLASTMSNFAPFRSSSSDFR